MKFGKKYVKSYSGNLFQLFNLYEINLKLKIVIMIIMLNIDFILKLYNKHISVIKNNRKNMIDRLNSKATVPLESGGKNGCGIELHSGWHPQFADTEAEITMLLLLEFKPKKVVEFSPCNGWSTALILDTLNHNNNNLSLIHI